MKLFDITAKLHPDKAQPAAAKLTEQGFHVKGASDITGLVFLKILADNPDAAIAITKDALKAIGSPATEVAVGA